jgi:phage-related protein
VTPVFWVGNVLREIRALAPDARHALGVELMRVQAGLEPRSWKPMPAVGPGVREIRVGTVAGAYRLFYVMARPDGIHVLHAFRKDTQRTARRDIELGQVRYKLISRKTD